MAPISVVLPCGLRRRKKSENTGTVERPVSRAWFGSAFSLKSAGAEGFALTNNAEALLFKRLFDWLNPEAPVPEYMTGVFVALGAEPKLFFKVTLVEKASMETP